MVRERPRKESFLRRAAMLPSWSALVTSAVECCRRKARGSPLPPCGSGEAPWPFLCPASLSGGGWAGGGMNCACGGSFPPASISAGARRARMGRTVSASCCSRFSSALYPRSSVRDGFCTGPRNGSRSGRSICSSSHRGLMRVRSAVRRGMISRFLLTISASSMWKTLLLSRPSSTRALMLSRAPSDTSSSSQSSLSTSRRALSFFSRRASRRCRCSCMVSRRSRERSASSTWSCALSAPPDCRLASCWTSLSANCRKRDWLPRKPAPRQATSSCPSHLRRFLMVSRRVSKRATRISISSPLDPAVSLRCWAFIWSMQSIIPMARLMMSLL
mmetsp:Transcript_50604/g.161936  ORF Transcript_50604/g.161936 Transcript_50604/m.161936 type:complete len:331 (-) Transcript_50604:5362-6354(-)